MNRILFAAGESHTGHDHGALGELVEKFTALLPLPEAWQNFIAHFFTDALEILFLFVVVMTIVYFASSYLNLDKLHHKLAHLKSLPGFALALVVGMLSPLCSCSIIPILIGLLAVGVPVSVCLCYLTASSMLNITALLSLFAVTGAEFSVAYIVCALAVIILSSVAFSLLHLDDGTRHYMDEHHHHHEAAVCDHCFWHRLRCALLSTQNVLKKCWVYILLGILLSSAITSFFSMETITEVINGNSFLSTTIVSLIGIPIHSDIFSISPVLLLLLEISPPIALAFALSTMAVSIPSVVILTRALKGKTVAIYCGVIIALTLIMGYLAIFIL